MVEAVLLRDLAVGMVMAAAITVLFHRLRQPVVLGYLVADSPYPFVTDIRK